ncbi:MAG: sulfatase, partial [Leadbetterella sp.]
VDKGSDSISWSGPFREITKMDYPLEYRGNIRGFAGNQAKEVIEKHRKENIGKEFIINHEGKSVPNYGIIHSPFVEELDVQDDAYKDGVVASIAVKKIKELGNSSQPFFYAIGFDKPHLPFVAPKKYWDLYDPKAILLDSDLTNSTNAPSYPSELTSQYSDEKGQPISKEKEPISVENQRRAVHGYYASVSYVDAQIGKVLDAIYDNGLDSNTIVILWGDHGWHLGDHGHWAKHSNYEQATRSPLIISGPGINPDQKTSSITEFVDVFPTLTELAHINLPSELEGKSLVPILKDPTQKVKQYARSEYPRGNHIMGYTIRTEKYRYIAWIEVEYRKQKPTKESKVLDTYLYDYQVDPLEVTNLTTTPTYESVKKELHCILISEITK